MKLFDKEDLLWGLGLHLLLTFALVVFIISLRYFDWKISAAIAGALLAVGVGAIIYISVKSPED